MVYRTGAPTLLRASLSSALKALHSAPVSIRWSERTSPQPPHTLSPRVISSTTEEDRHSGHFFGSNEGPLPESFFLSVLPIRSNLSPPLVGAGYDRQYSLLSHCTDDSLPETHKITKWKILF